MGIESRDYYRESSRYSDARSGWSGGGLPPIIKFIIITNIVVFVAQIFITRTMTQDDVISQYEDFFDAIAEEQGRELTDEEKLQLLGPIPREERLSIVQNWFQLQTSKVVGQWQVWRVLTSAFCHNPRSIWHILFNMYVLYLFGVALESMYGSREFLRFYLLAAIVASLGYIALDLATSGNTPAIGASGAVMGVAVLYAIHFPRDRLYVFGIIGVEVRVLVTIYIIIDLHPVLMELAGLAYHTGVAHAAHLGGAAFGFAYWRSGVRLERLFGGFSLFGLLGSSGRRGNLRVFAPSDDSANELDGEVDDILQKLHEEGEESLTDAEREVLFNASKRMKRRRK